MDFNIRVVFKILIAIGAVTGVAGCVLVAVGSGGSETEAPQPSYVLLGIGLVMCLVSSCCYTASFKNGNGNGDGGRRRSGISRKASVASLAVPEKGFANPLLDNKEATEVSESERAFSCAEDTDTLDLHLAEGSEPPSPSPLAPITSFLAFPPPPVKKSSTPNPSSLQPLGVFDPASRRSRGRGARRSTLPLTKGVVYQHPEPAHFAVTKNGDIAL
eukprot:TRINITY_DN31776_c0_g1_i1.p1 TRINITY_DN31776_c0_g1~~TRINITY_DN31776_c0_g1_i1.p1  ORF type:complete len:230 (+),score=34.95 TRINITY_DN31776_c0_g1_i1:43-690(+)